MHENSTSGHSDISRRVLDAISQERGFENMEIHVRSNGGAVTLTGTASQNFKDAAEARANSLEGVQQVINNIVIGVHRHRPHPGGPIGCDPLHEKECQCNGTITCVPI